MADINVTPRVDVMLLIVFIVRRPLHTAGVLVGQSGETLGISIRKHGQLWLQGSLLETAALVLRLVAIAESKADTPSLSAATR